MRPLKLSFFIEKKNLRNLGKSEVWIPKNLGKMVRFSLFLIPGNLVLLYFKLLREFGKVEVVPVFFKFEFWCDVRELKVCGLSLLCDGRFDFFLLPGNLGKSEFAYSNGNLGRRGFLTNGSCAKVLEPRGRFWHLVVAKVRVNEYNEC